MPLLPIFRNFFKMPISRQHSGGALLAPSGNARISVSTISRQAQKVRDRRRLDSKLLLHSGLIPQNLASTIELHYARTDDALRQVLIWRANEHLLHALIPRGFCGGGS